MIHQSSNIVPSQKPRGPNSPLGRGHFTLQRMDPPLPPLSPINDNTLGSVNVAVALSNSSCRLNTIMVSATDVFFYSSPLDAILLKYIILRDSSPNHSRKSTVASGINLSEDVQAGAIKWRQHDGDALDGDGGDEKLQKQ